jgi:hypothetical protein
MSLGSLSSSEYREAMCYSYVCLRFAADRMHRSQPLRFFRNLYEFRAKITVLRSTVYLLRVSDYCRPGTVPHLNIIVQEMDRSFSTIDSSRETQKYFIIGISRALTFMRF